MQALSFEFIIDQYGFRARISFLRSNCMNKICPLQNASMRSLKNFYHHEIAKKTNKNEVLICFIIANWIACL